MGLALLLGVGLALVASGVVIAVYALADNPASRPPRLGLRGYKRQEALEFVPGFRTADPIVRRVASWVSHLPVARLRVKADRRLQLAGDYLGLTSDEWIGAIALGGALGAVAGLFTVRAADFPSVVVLVFAVFGAYGPYNAVDVAQQSRRRDVERALPSTIDLVSLCMSAGLTFPSALQDIVTRWPNPRDAMCEELRFILRLLDLGHSRSHALELFAERVPTEAVSDFVAAVKQAEAKGTPLAKVLAIQAMVMRSRRSMVAEEAAAKAAVKMILPLVMLLMCTFILIAGPLFLKTMQQGF